MKRLFLLATTVVMCATRTNAQFRIGPELGLNITSASYSQSFGFGAISPSSSVLIGAKGGVIADLGLGDRFAIQPGVFYSMKGFKLTYTGFGSVNVTMRINYIEVPVNVMYKTGSEGSGRFFFGAGPYIGYALGGRAKASGLGVSENISLPIGNNDSTDLVKPIDLGGNINAGYELPMGLYARGQFGYSFINTSPLLGISQNNWGATISVGYLIGFNSKGKQ